VRRWSGMDWMLMLRLRNLDGRMADMRHGMIGHWRSCRLWIQVGSYIVPGVGFEAFG
jgi:hypothetical protein